MKMSSRERHGLRKQFSELIVDRLNRGTNTHDMLITKLKDYTWPLREMAWINLSILFNAETVIKEQANECVRAL